MVSLRRLVRQPSTFLAREMPGRAQRFAALVGPGFRAPKCEIIGIGGGPARRLLRFNHLIGSALALAIVDRFFLGVEAKGDLLLHVAGAGPAHQRLDHSRLLGFIIEPPLLGYGGGRFHPGFCRRFKYWRAWMSGSRVVAGPVDRRAKG